MKKLFSRGELDKALAEAGLISYPRNGYAWLLRREKMGVLVCPRDPVTGIRVFNEEQIAKIVKAFSVGGVGKYIHENKK